MEHIMIRTEIKGKRRFVKVKDSSFDEYLVAIGDTFNVPRNTNLAVKMFDNTRTPIEREDFANILQTYNNGDFCIHVEYEIDCNSAADQIHAQVSYTKIIAMIQCSHYCFLLHQYIHFRIWKALSLKTVVTKFCISKRARANYQRLIANN